MLLLTQPNIEINATNKVSSDIPIEYLFQNTFNLWLIGILLFQYGYTPLHRAVDRRHVQIVEILLTQPNIEINAKDNVSSDIPIEYLFQNTFELWLMGILLFQHCDTPLHRAVNHGHLQIVEILLTQPNIEINAKSNVSSDIPIEYLFQNTFKL